MRLRYDEVQDIARRVLGRQLTNTEYLALAVGHRRTRVRWGMVALYAWAGVMSVLIVEYSIAGDYVMAALGFVAFIVFGLAMDSHRRRASR